MSRKQLGVNGVGLRVKRRLDALSSVEVQTSLILGTRLLHYSTDPLHPKKTGILFASAEERGLDVLYVQHLCRTLNNQTCCYISSEL